MGEGDPCTAHHHRSGGAVMMGRRNITKPAAVEMPTVS
jgi:hypothetical protein